MGNTHWGLGINLVFICIFLATMADKCMGGGNLTAPACSEKERLALLRFKHSVRDDHGMLSSWVGDDCCKWERVGCDDVTGRVVSLNLRRITKEGYQSVDPYRNLDAEDYVRVLSNDDYLVGDEVNSCLTELMNLKHLDLSGNDFQGSRVPEFMGSLKQLRYLNLSDAGLSCDIPHQIGNLSNLKVLDLGAGRYYSQGLMAYDMAWISGLSKLEHLDLSGINFSITRNLDNLVYSIPSLTNLWLSYCGLSMADLGSRHLNSSRERANIKDLDLSENGFMELPSLFLNMTSLALLDLSCNYVSTRVSTTWRFENLLNMMPSVSTLRLSSCGLQKVNFSPISSNFSTHFNIKHLGLDRNKIEGGIPYVLTNMSSLLSLDLSFNELSSSIPFMPSLRKLDITANNFRRIEDVGIWRHCSLKELIVSRNNLEGEIIGPSTNVSKCSQNTLEILDLSDNALNGSIPESLGRLTSLRQLDLSWNELTGSIPEALGKLTYLTTIHLKVNGFTGPIPVSLGKLKLLRVLSVSSNLLNGTIPNSIGQLTKLYFLDVSNNSLQGVVSEALFANLSKLKYLDTYSNTKLLINISGDWIPPFQLKEIRLGSCRIEDGFPQWLQTQRELEMLVLSNTSISGILPAWLRLMPVIRVLDLSYNQLTGPLTNLPYLYEVRYGLGGDLLLKNNLFTGLIPRGLCKMTYLKVLDLSRNRLTGKIPKCLWDTSLAVIVLGSNRLSGVIPRPLGLNPSLEWLQLNDNNFSGKLPQAFVYFTHLVVLDLGENKISGNIPEWIGENITRLTVLRLHKNNFTGRIPHSLCKSQLLQILDLAHNNLSGSIPYCFRQLDAMKLEDRFNNFYFHVSSFQNMMQVLKGATLEYKKTLEFVISMDLSSNKLVGEVPEALMALDALVGLNLSNNRLSGNIPKNIGNIKYLFSLDLSANELSGTIPRSMADLTFLSHLNLSHNNLSGKIPTGNQLRTLTDPSIYADNTYLCGAPMPKDCYPHENPPTTTSKKKDETANEPNKLWFYLDVACGFATGFWGIIGVLIVKKEWRHKLFMFCEVAMDKMYVAVTVRVLKLKRGRGREAA